MKRLLLCLCVVLLATCGKRGNPLPPLQRIPAAPADLTITRVDDQVYARFTVPSTNIDGATPADIARVELYALTLERLPGTFADIDPEELREVSTLVAAEDVRRPLPSPPPAKEGMPPIPLPPPGPGVDQGTVLVFREQLTPALQAPVVLPDVELPRSVEAAIASEDVPRALVMPAPGAGVQRYYYVVALSPSGRYGPHSGVAPAPLGTTSSAPAAPEITVDEASMTVRWTPPPDARGVAAPGDPSWLPSKSMMPPAAPTTYDVYEVPRNASADAPVAVPTPLTPAPVGATEFTQQGITHGVERCFTVRAVDVLDGVHVRGPASPVTCASFADTFAPSAPRELVAVAVPGAVNLIWEPSDAKDVAGYLVLRTEAGGATLAPLMTTPMTRLSYRDDTVQAGVRYAYAVVAVDRAGNRSAESNRVEETAQ